MTENEIQKALKPYRNKGFSIYQLEEIYYGFCEGLTKEQIDIYASLKYDDDQMEQLRLGLQDNLDVYKYYNPSYTWYKMFEIRDKLLKIKEWVKKN